MLLFARRVGATEVDEKDFASDAACPAWKKSVDKELFEKVAWDEVPDPEAWPVEDRYGDAVGGEPDSNWNEV